MSPIQSRELSLTELIEESNLIIEVEFAAKYKEEIPVTRMNHVTSSFETFPPFIKNGCVFIVKNILKNSDKIKVPERISVPDEDWRRSLNQHRSEYLSTPDKSYNISEYKSKVKVISKASLLFLHHFQSMYELTAKKAFENNEGLEKVGIILSNAQYGQSL